MALSGNLRDFSLPDVFQLVSFSRKTGTLAIDRGNAKGFVYFRDGDVFFAISNWNREPMGRRLVRAEKITDRQLKRALELQADDKERRRLGQILVDEGFLSPKVLETFVQEQIQDTIFDLFRWEEGDFDFKAGVIPTEEDVGLTVSVENIIMEGSRRLEEWDRIRKKIPGDDSVFRMATAPGEGTFEISLKSSEWKLLCLLDGRRTVLQLSELLEMSDFEVSRILYGMFSGGLLERVASDGSSTTILTEQDTALQERAAKTSAEAPVRDTAAASQGVEASETIPEVPEVAGSDAIAEAEAGTGAGEPLGAEETAEIEQEQATVEVRPTAPPAEEIESPRIAEQLPGEGELLEAGIEEGELAAEEEMPDAATASGAPAESAAAGPVVEVGEVVEQAGAGKEEGLFEGTFGDETEQEEELEVSDFDLTDELAALTGTSGAKSRPQTTHGKAAPPSEEVPLHVDKRLNKELLLKIIDGVKRL